MKCAGRGGLAYWGNSGFIHGIPPAHLAQSGRALERSSRGRGFKSPDARCDPLAFSPLSRRDCLGCKRLTSGPGSFSAQEAFVT